MSTTKKKSGTKKPAADTTEKARKAAIAAIDARLDGKEPSAPTAATAAKAGKPPKGGKSKASAKAAAPKAPKAPKVQREKKVSLLDAAAKVLAGAKEPMGAQAMVDAAVGKKLWTPGKGKTPQASLYAAVIREIAARGRESRFKKTDRGMFAATGKGA